MTTTTTLPSDAELGEIVAEVWSSFLDEALLDGFGLPEPAGTGKVIGWVSISGTWTGHLYVTTTADGARDITATMFQLGHDEVGTAEIADAIGEIANMVGGSIKGMVGGETALSLPQVALDAGALVSPDAHELVSVRSIWRGEPIEFALWERQNAESTRSH
jgi:chemotaxis protein CheX